MDDTISEQAYQVLNWARKIAVMNKQELSAHFKKLSKTAKKQLASIPVINSQPKTASFPLVLPLTASEHQNAQLSPASTARNESPTQMDTVPVLSTPPIRTTRNRREAFNDSENEDEEYQARIRPRRVTDRVAPVAPVVIYAEHQNIKELLTIYAPIKRWQRYAETTSYQRQPLYETAQMISLSNLQEIEVDELITKFYIDIKNSLTLALECESKAAFHHFNIGQKLAILHDRLQNDIPRLKNILKEGLSMDLRTFRRYRNYYELLTEMPRFKHCTISFRRMRDIIPQIRKWFQSAECQALPGTHILSRGFWRSEPTEYHNFDSVKAINDHEDDPSQSEIDADSTDEELIEEDDLLEEETETPNNRPITLELFRNNTIWFNYNPQAHSESLCTICQESYNVTSRISSLACTHFYHEGCIQQWLTSHSCLCPLCNYVVG